MRRIFGKTLLEIAEKDDRLVLLHGDVEQEMSEYASRWPEKFFNFGLTEQSMISIAAGMALEGLKPWVYTITPFLIERPFEQIKLDIDQQNVNVKLVGFADYPHLGPTHTELNGEKLMQLFTNITSFFPNDGGETQKMAIQAYKKNGPAFISLKSDPTLSKSITGTK